MLSRDAREGGFFRKGNVALLRVVAIAMVVAPALSACGGSGFRPMYAASAGGETLGAKMAQVSITTIPGRVGQQLRNELIFQTTGGGEQIEKAYKLDVILRERLTSQLVDAQGNAETQIYHLDADFQLTDTRKKTVILKGQSFGRAGFQRFQTIYANVRAKRDAENRTARTVAVDIKGRIEAFLSR
jgi:LPS-assembly lipoprotein